MIILGITGPIGCGKSTFAANLHILANKYNEFESSDLIMSVANALKLAAKSGTPPTTQNIKAINTWLESLPDILLDRVHVSVKPEQLYLTDDLISNQPELATKLFVYLAQADSDRGLWSESINRTNKTKHRALLQWLGGYLPKRIDGKIWYEELIRQALSDPNSDLTTIGGVRFAADAKCIKEAGGYIVRIERPDIQVQDNNDVTERERVLINADTVIINNGTLEQLQECAHNLWKDITVGHLLPRYVSNEA